MSKAPHIDRADDAKQAASGGGRWLLVAFIVSLSVNMLVLGALGVMLFAHYMGGPERFGWMGRMHERMDARLDAAMQGAGAADSGMRREGASGMSMKAVARLRLARPGLLLASMRALMLELPARRRQALREVVRGHRGAIAEAHARVAQARSALLAQMERPQMDATAYGQALQALHRAEAMARQHVLALFRDFSWALTPEERRRFVEIMRQKAQRRHLFRRY